MILLKNLKLNNFLSHEDTDIVFNKNTKLLIDGKSGTGKSSIIDAIIWCLYGVSRTDNKSIIKHGESKTTVSLELVESNLNISYLITRSTTDKAKNTLEISETTDDGIVPISRNGLKDKQDWIEKELLRCSYTLFVNSIAYPQNNVDNFVYQNAPRRKDLLLEIANISDFDLYYARARDLLQLKNEEKIRLESLLSINTRSIDEKKLLVVDISELKTELDSINFELTKEGSNLELLISEKSKIGDFMPQINGIKINIHEKEKDVSLLKTNIESKRRNIEICEAIDIESLKEKTKDYEILKNRKNELELAYSQEVERTNRLLALMSNKPTERDYDSEISQLNQRLIPLIKETGSCPAGDNCPFVLPIKSQISYLEEQIKEKTELKGKLDQEKNEYTKRVSEIGLSAFSDENKVELQSVKTQVSSCEEAISKLAIAQAQIDTLPVLRSELSELETRLFKLNDEISVLKIELLQKEEAQRGIDTTAFTIRERDIRSRINDLSVKASILKHKMSVSDDASKSIDKLTEENSKIISDVENVNKTIDDLSSIKEAFGSKGLKTVVIDYLIPRLEEKINEVLSSLSDFRITLDTQKTGSDGESIIEGLFINIYNENGEKLDFASYSGGEKIKISMAISEALASLSNKIGFRLLDEAINSLDNESTQDFITVLLKLQDNFPQMVSISHIPEIKDIFEDKIQIIKNRGVSRII